MWYSYFESHIDDDLVHFEFERISRDIDLPTINYIDEKIENAPEPEMDWGLYFVTVAKLARIKNSTFILIADTHTHMIDWQKQKKELINKTNSLLDSLGLPTYSS